MSYNFSPHLTRYVIPIRNNTLMTSLKREFKPQDLNHLKHFLTTTIFKEVQIYTKPEIDDDELVVEFRGNPKEYFV